MGLKKLGKILKSSASDVLKGGVKAVAGYGAQTATAVQRGGNILSGIATGNTDKIESNIKKYGQDTIQNTKAQYGGGIQATSGAASMLTGGQASYIANPINNKAQSVLGDTRTAQQVQRDQNAANATAEQAALDAEEAARPEAERKAMINKRYQNALLAGGGRSYNNILGGGF